MYSATFLIMQVVTAKLGFNVYHGNTTVNSSWAFDLPITASPCRLFFEFKIGRYWTLC